MSFTDDDLKRLKEWASECGCTHYEGSNPCWHQEVQALLARLEAAEAVCTLFDSEWTHDKYWEVLTDWRKASGKTRGG